MGWEKTEFTAMERVVQAFEKARDLAVAEDLKKLEQLMKVLEAQEKAKALKEKHGLD